MTPSTPSRFRGRRVIGVVLLAVAAAVCLGVGVLALFRGQAVLWAVGIIAGVVLLLGAAWLHTGRRPWRKKG